MRELKKLILIFLFSLLTSVVIAAPGGGGGGAGGHGSPGGGGPGGPSGGPSGGPGSSSAPAGTPGRGPSDPAPGGFGTPSSGSVPSSSAPVVPPQNVLKYRGTRTACSKDEFCFKSVKTRSESEDSVLLEIRFNQNVNPLSFKNDSILIDGEAVSADTKFSFNRKGDTIRFSVPSVEHPFSLEIQGVESFNGIKIKPVELKDVSVGTTIKN